MQKSDFSAFLYDLWEGDVFGFYDDFILTCSFFVEFAAFCEKKGASYV